LKNDAAEYKVLLTLYLCVNPDFAIARHGIDNLDIKSSQPRITSSQSHNLIPRHPVSGLFRRKEGRKEKMASDGWKGREIEKFDGPINHCRCLTGFSTGPFKH
jgi:hypothetical protein